MAGRKPTPLRVPPHNLEAEESVLGAMLITPGVIPAVVEQVSKSDFYRDSHRLLYRAIVELWERGAPGDAITLTEHLTAKGELDKVTGGKNYIHTLVHNCPAASNAARYAEIVKDYAVRRSIIEAGNEIARVAHEGTGKVSELLAGSQERLTSISEEVASSASDVSHVSWLDLLKNPPDPPKGLIGDGVLVESGSLVIGASPGVGKTMLVMDLALSLAEGKPFLGHKVAEPVNVLFVEQEGAPGEFFQRLKRKASGLPEEAAARLHFPKGVMGNLKLDSGDGLNQLRAAIKAINAKVVILDPLITFHTGKENESDEMQRLTDNLKLVMDEEKVSVVLVHHTRKEQPGAKEPLDMLRGSSVIAAFAETVLLLSKDNQRKGAYRQLTYAKVRHDKEPDNLILHLREDNLTFEVEAVKSSLAVTEAEVYRVVKEHGLIWKGDICKHFSEDATERTMEDRLAGLVSKGLVEAVTSNKKKFYQVPQESLL
jgi:replicative DNA helicase